MSGENLGKEESFRKLNETYLVPFSALLPSPSGEQNTASEIRKWKGKGGGRRGDGRKGSHGKKKKRNEGGTIKKLEPPAGRRWKGKGGNGEKGGRGRGRKKGVARPPPRPPRLSLVALLCSNAFLPSAAAANPSPSSAVGALAVVVSVMEKQLAKDSTNSELSSS